MADPDDKTVAFMETKTYFKCRAYAEVGMCSGSKYRFCVPQNRRTCRKAAGLCSKEETA
ncbi:hypothetical protein NXV73_01970 [Bacteroides salyersiae]|nr:hypothetical protein [Bacteroides salyersiae]